MTTLGYHYNTVTEAPENTSVCRSSEPAVRSTLERLDDQSAVEPNDHQRHQPRDRLCDLGVGILAHDLAVAREHHEGDHSERQLKRKNDLADDQQVVHPPIACRQQHDERRHDSDEASPDSQNPALDLPVQEPLHHHLPRERPCDRALLTASKQSTAEEDGGKFGTQHARQELRRLPDICHVVVPRAVESGSGDDEDGGVDEEGKDKRQVAVQGGVEDSLGDSRRGLRLVSHLDDAAVQVEILRHHSGSEDTNAHEQHALVGDEAGRRYERPLEHLNAVGAGEHELDSEADADGGDHSDDKNFEYPHAILSDDEEDEDVEGRDDDTPDEGDAEEKIEGDGRPYHLR
mmetsp:Transcript_6081/g.14029  ORF Transcript_6081/g.14029 Transcript_6081/m.14029 type:complete len:346 (+) Transcript_6081:57-1094(+)